MDWVITRHHNTAQYVVKKMKLQEYTRVDRLSDGVLSEIKPGDNVYGILPLYLIYRILMKGARYYTIVLPHVHPDKWTKELTEDELVEAGIEIHEVRSLQLQRADAEA